VRREARLLAHQDDVCIRELPAVCLDPLPGLPEQLERVRARELRVAGRKERADVLQPGRPEQRIGERMREDVPSEWPASPRGCSIRTPPSTSGTPSASACASKPVPTRYSDTIERLRQLGERADGDGADGRLDSRMRAPADADGAQAGRERRTTSLSTRSPT
jgi:hypothetical protein